MDRKCGNACERIAKKYDEKVKEYIYIVEEGAIALLSRIQPRNYHFRPNESRGTPLAISDSRRKMRSESRHEFEIDRGNDPTHASLFSFSLNFDDRLRRDER